MKKKRELIYFFFLFIFSVCINQYYGSIGVFPIDTFLFYDTGFRTLNGYLPTRDFWINSGFLIDIIQALFFKIFGVSWFSYVFHASVFNFLIAAATFFTFKKFNLNIHLTIFYSLLVSILAYPISGTPFLDHHSMILSLIALFCFILSLKGESIWFWFFTPIFLWLGFLSKQTPAAYIGLIILIISIIYFLFNLNFKKILFFLSGGVSIILITFLLLLIFNIEFNSFFEQIFLFPLTIGGDRIQNFLFPIEFNRIILRFKLIHISQAILIIVIAKKIYENFRYIKNAEFYILISIILASFSLIFHQLLTLNQKFIFFIIPMLLGFSNIYYNKYFKKNIFVIFFLVFLGASSTIYYKFTYLDNRKFMELENVDLKKTVKANIIDNKLNYLNWINPVFQGSPDNEIKLLKESIEIINNDSRKKILATHYQFIASLLNDNVFSPNRTYSGNGISYPLIENQNFIIYKKFFLNQIIKNEIKIIYTLKPISDYIFLNILEKKCVKTKKINEILFVHDISACKFKY